METAHYAARAAAGFRAVKRSRRLLAGASLTLIASAAALGGAAGTAQAATSASGTTIYEFLGEVHPEGQSAYCLTSTGQYDTIISSFKCDLHGYLHNWGAEMLCKKVGGKELCTGSLYILSASGGNPTGGAVGVYGPTSPHYKDAKNDVVLCPPDTTQCLTGLSWIPEGTGGTKDEIWVPARSNAAILYELKLKGNGEDVELGKANSHYGAVWTHPAWEEQSS